MIITRRSLKYIFNYIIIWLISFAIISRTDDFETVALIQFITFVLMYINIGLANKNMLTTYSVLVIMLYLFQNGQILLYALGAQYDFFYVTRYDAQTMYQTVYFSYMCMCATFAAGVLATKASHTSKFFLRMNNVSTETITNVATSGFWICAMVAYVNVFVKFALVVSNGYFSVMEYTSHVPSYIGLFEVYFVAFSIMLLVYERNNKSKKYMVSTTFVLWSLLTALTGDRTNGMGGIVTVALMYFNNIFGTKGKGNVQDNRKGRRYITLIFIAVISCYIISYAFSFRMHYTYENASVLDTMVSAIGGLGFSFFPLTLTMEICPSSQNFLYGKSMIGGLISGLFPESIDILGIADVFRKWSSEPSQWIESYYNYTFGIDFSLNAECYANFGNYGWIAMFALCVILAVLLKNIDFRRKDNLFSQYVSFALLFGWFTLPRRKSYYIYNKIFWYVIIMSAIVVIAESIMARKINRGGVNYDALINRFSACEIFGQKIKRNHSRSFYKNLMQIEDKLKVFQLVNQRYAL